MQESMENINVFSEIFDNESLKAERDILEKERYCLLTENLSLKEQMRQDKTEMNEVIERCKAFGRYEAREEARMDRMRYEASMETYEARELLGKAETQRLHRERNNLLVGQASLEIELWKTRMKLEAKEKEYLEIEVWKKTKKFEAQVKESLEIELRKTTEILEAKEKELKDKTKILDELLKKLEGKEKEFLGIEVWKTTKHLDAKEKESLEKSLWKTTNRLEAKEREFKDKAKMVDELLEKVVCPVCMEVPRSSPVPQCPNGHIICGPCLTKLRRSRREMTGPGVQGTRCPCCRENMANVKNLLAAVVVENMEHKCRTESCGRMVPFKLIKEHQEQYQHEEEEDSYTNEQNDDDNIQDDDDDSVQEDDDDNIQADDDNIQEDENLQHPENLHNPDNGHHPQYPGNGRYPNIQENYEDNIQEFGNLQYSENLHNLENGLFPQFFQHSEHGRYPSIHTQHFSIQESLIMRRSHYPLYEPYQHETFDAFNETIAEPPLSMISSAAEEIIDIADDEEDEEDEEDAAMIVGEVINDSTNYLTNFNREAA